MGRGVSSGGGQSSLGYLFGSDEPPRQRPNNRAPPPEPQQPATKQTRDGFGRNVQTQEKPTGNNMPAAGKVIDDSGSSLEMGAGRMGRNNNNYFRAEGQNAGNFITVWLLRSLSLLDCQYSSLFGVFKRFLCSSTITKTYLDQIPKMLLATSSLSVDKS